VLVPVAIRLSFTATSAPINSPFPPQLTPHRRSWAIV
jgi:hypothetical protein